MEDQSRHFEAAHGLLRHGGYLILTTPNKPIFDDLLAHGLTDMQPIENWVGKATLRRMAGAQFQVVRLKTIRPHCRLGLFRAFNYFTVRSLAERIRMRAAFETLACAWGGGLHLFLVAKKV